MDKNSIRTTLFYIAEELNAEQIGENIWIVHLSNGKSIRIERDVDFNGSRWAWKIDHC